MSIEKEEAYPIPETIGPLPGSATELKFPKYAFPGLFGDAAMEELAARILMRSWVHKKWCGASMIDIWDEMQAAADQASCNVHRAKLDKLQEDEFQRALFTRTVWAWCTLGIALYFITRPKLPQKTVVEVPKTLGNDAMTDALRKLVKGGWIVMADGKIREQDQDLILYPTVQLVVQAISISQASEK